MIDKHSIWIIRELSVSVLTALLLLSVWGRADKQRWAEVLQDGRVEFTPNKRSFFAWPALVVFYIYATISLMMHIQGSPLNLMSAVFCGVLTVMIAVSFPAKIMVPWNVHSLQTVHLSSQLHTLFGIFRSHDIGLVSGWDR
jgi:hypothetical protein